MRLHLFIGASSIAIASSCLHAGILSDWNLVVRNDLTFSSSEVEGSALIGGDISGGASVYAAQAVTESNGTGLSVGGSILAGTVVAVNNSGNLRITSASNVMGTANINGGSLIQDATIGGQVNALHAAALSAQTHLANLTTTGTIDGAGNLNSNTTLTLDGQQVAVYSMTQTQFDSGLGQLNLNFGSADSVIINFIAGPSGHAEITAPPNFVGGFSQSNSSRILWNFVDATELTVSGNFNGAVLAPLANLSLTSGGINGSVIIDALELQEAEIRPDLYIGYVPAPGTIAPMLGFGVLAGRRRRA